MFRFTIRDVLWLTGIAALSLGIGKVYLRADNVEEYAVTFAMFLVGAVAYVVAAFAWRWARSP